MTEPNPDTSKRSGSFLKNLRKRYRQAYVRVLRSPGAPGEVAGGMALGLFIAMLPIMGAQMPIAVVCAEIVRRLTGLKLSRIAAAAGVWLTNPVTAVPIYWAVFKIGQPFARLVLPDRHLSPEGTDLSAAVSEAAVATDPSLMPDSGVLAAIGRKVLGSLASSSYVTELVVGLVIGGVITGIPIAIVGYKVTHAIVMKYQARRAIRRARLENIRPPGSATV